MIGSAIGKRSNKKNCGQIFLYTVNFTQRLWVPQRYGGRQHQNQKRMIQSAASVIPLESLSGANDQFTTEAQGAGSG
jgi:hypothetical protein